MNPTNGSNPYMAILSQLQGGQSAGLPGGPTGAPGGGGMPPAGGAPAMQGGMPSGAPGGMPQGAPGQLGMGGQQAPGAQSTKMLLGALQSLHQFALQAVDPQEVQLIRQIIVLLSSLIQKDQARQLQGGQPGGSMPQPMGQAGGPTPPMSR